MFEKDFIKLVVQIFGGVGLFFGVFALLMPIKLVTELIPLYQVVTITGILYAVFGIGRAVWKRREGSVLLGVGCVVLFGTAINDILVALQTLDVENKLHLGVLVFVMLQSVSVTLRYARAFQIIEQQSSELTKTNLELQLEEKLRRTAEGESIALHEQVDHSEKINTLGIIAHTLAEDLRRDKTSTLANRAAQVMSDISNLLRHAPVERGSLNITQLLADFLKSDEFREISDAYPTLQIISDFDNSVSVIEGSATHLFTLLVNTVRYVMASQPEDQVVLFSGRCSEVEHQTLFNQEIEAGEYYILGISDEGEGIDAVDLLEIFDPSQQARAYADLEGPLLNLAAAWKILESHGGALDVYAVPGVTRFPGKSSRGRCGLIQFESTC